MVRKSLLLVGLIFILVTAAAFAADENPEGQITIVGSNIETLNPLLSESTYETTVLNGIYSQLVRLDDTGGYVPDLAKEVPSVDNGGISPDGMTFTFHLREDATWHDGEPVTAEDVKFTWEMIMNDKAQVVSRSGFDEIESIETPDPHTVIMHKNKATANWISNWAQTSGAIIPKHLWEEVDPTEFTKGHEYSRKPVGSGPFKFEEWEPQSHVVMEANEDYYGDGPYLERVIYREVDDNNTQLTMLRTGEADIALNMDGGHLEQLEGIDRLQVTQDPASTYSHMTFNLDNPIFQDVKTRQALSYALPREQIIDRVLNGVGIPAASSTYPNLWAYDDSIEPYPYDMDKARELLTEAGWQDVDGDGILENEDGHKFEFSLYTNAGRAARERIAQITQQIWGELGIEVNIELQETTTLFGPTLENREFDMILFAWVTGADPDEYTLYHSEQIPGEENGYTGQNYIGYSNEDVDALLEAGTLLMNNEDRIPIYHKIQQMLYEEVPMLYIYWYVNVNAAPEKLANWRPAPFTNANSWNIYEWKLK